MNPQVTLASSIPYGSDQFLAATLLLLQVVPTTSKERIRVSSLQPTCLPVAHEDDEAPCYYMFSAAELCNMLAFGYAIYNVLFFSKKTKDKLKCDN